MRIFPFENTSPRSDEKDNPVSRLNREFYSKAPMIDQPRVKVEPRTFGRTKTPNSLEDPFTVLVSASNGKRL